MKCQRCHRPAILHITEVEADDRYEEFHLCEECGQRHLADAAAPPEKPKAKPGKPSGREEHEEALAINERQCEECSIKFVDFRNTGRLGCPHDYNAFQTELVPLLESIHGATRHAGKVPRRLPQTRSRQTELAGLRKQLQEAVRAERYEEAARLRDRLRQLGSE